MEDFAALYMDVVPQAMRLLRAEVRKEAKEFLTIPQFRVLANIMRGLSCVNEISAHHGTSQPAMSKMVEGLAARGLLAREADPTDRRRQLLRLTPKGKSLYRKIEKKSSKNLALLLKNSEASEESVVRALKDLRLFIEGLESKKNQNLDGKT